ncbi:MAG: fibronectin type III domain-containing protein, partial [Thermoguttaceae bacterium]|nr:fibronectin type III domain-containing protein [Thermoguttaceae bacterium]
MKFFDASRYASPLRKALDKKENAPRNLRFETLENRALLSVTPLDALEPAIASAEIAPAQTVETPVVDLSTLAASNATLESNADDQYEGENGNNSYENATPLGTLTQTTTLEAFAGSGREQDWYRVNFQYAGTADDYLRLETPEGVNVNNLYLALKTATGGNQAHTVEVVDGAKVISLEGLKAGEYTVQVYYSGSGTGSSAYTLTIEPPKPESDDRYENVSDGVDDNDSFANAYDLGMLGDLTLNAKAGPSRNADYFKFTTVGAGTADNQIALSAAANATLNFRLYSANDTQTPIAETMTSKGAAVLSLQNLAAGDYYVLVENNNDVDSFVKYELTFDAPKDAPAQPKNLKTNGDEAEYNYTTLSWDAVDYITGYELRYTNDVEATDADATWTSVGTVAADVTTFTTDELGLKYGTEYKFEIRALRVVEGAHDRTAWDVASDWTGIVFSTVDAPEPPKDLAAAPLDAETLTVALSWTDLANELGYVVDLLDADGVSLLESPVELDADTTTWTTPALALGTTYKFQVTAKNNAGDATADLTFATENVPNAPTGLKATVADAAETSATLTWDAATETGAEAVVAYVVTYTDGQTVLTQTVDVATAENPTTCQLLNLVKGATYDVTVVAVNAYGDSAAATVKFSTLETPSTVVTTLSDVVDKYDGEISLREAIAYAEADATLGTTITFDAEAYADELDADGKATIV